MGEGIDVELDDKALLLIVDYAMRMLRKEGYDRNSLKEMVDKVCNEVPKGVK